MLPAQPNQSLIDGLACFQALASAGRPVGSREMARQLRLEPTRVNRLLKTLSALGIAQQDETKQYVPGPAMHVLAAQAMFGSGLMRRAMGGLESLRKHKLSVAMGVLWRNHVSYLYHGGPSTRPGDALGRTGLFPATRSGIGMVLLSRLPAAEIRALYAKQDIPNFPGGINTLMQALANIRSEQIALIQPYEDQPTRTLAIAIDNESAAIALSGVWDDKRTPGLSDALRAATHQITQGASDE